MKKVILFSTCIAAAATMAACGGPGAKGKAAADTAAAETKAVPEYTVINNATVDLAGFPQDKDGYYVIFDGKTFNGWRGYGKDHVPSNGRSTTVRSNSTVRAAVKPRTATAAT